MPTDSSDNITGNYPTHGPIIPCILDEGAPTVTATGTVLNMANVTSKVLTWASPLARGNYVAISDDTACTWAATGGIPVVERAVTTQAFVIGKIVSTPDEFEPPDDTDAANLLSERLAGGFYRTALVEIYGGITCLQKAEITADSGTTAVTVGQTDKLKHNLTSDYADDDTAEIKLIAAANGGTGIVAFHYCVNTASADVTNCLVGLTAPLTSITGV